MEEKVQHVRRLHYQTYRELLIMKYVLSIDWLAVYCLHIPAGSAQEQWTPSESDGSLLGAYPWRFRKADYGTRQFSQLHFVAMPNEEGGWDNFAEIQSVPYSHILEPKAIIVRFVNRSLYRPDFWQLADRLLVDNGFAFKSISRIDICADFNDFATISPVKLIEDFAAKRLRHVGRGVGALYFEHGVKMDVLTGFKDYGVRYTGLSFGTHSSDAHVYLYNKSFELLTMGDKPWIRDQWIRAGLDVRNVWRLEVSLKSSGCKFKDKETGEEVEITANSASDGDELTKFYHTFVRKLFSFVHNPMSQKNITREPRIKLFEGAPAYDRGVLRNLSGSGRMERILIKALYQLGDRYRGADIYESGDIAQSFAVALAESCDLARWMGSHIEEWEKPTHK